MGTEKTRGLWGKIVLSAFVIGGTEILWTLYNTYVPLWLQAGNPGFDTGSNVLIGFGFSASVTGIILTFDNIASLFISPVIGALSDTTRTRFGRRIPWIISTAPIATAAFILIPVFALRIPPELSGKTQELTGYLVPFIASLIVMLIPLAFMRVPSETLMYDISPSRHRTITSAISSVIGSSVGIIAAIVAAGLFAIHPGLPFWVFGCVVILIILMVFIFVKEPKTYEAAPASTSKRVHFKKVFAALKEMPAENKRSMTLIMATLFFYYLAFSQLGSFLSSYAVTILGMQVGSAGLLYAAGGGAFFLGSLPAGIIAKKIKRKPTALIGLGVHGGLSLLIYLTGNVTLVWICMVTLGFFSSFGMVAIEAMAVDSSPNDEFLGTQVSFMQAMRTLAYIVGPIFGGFLIEKFNNNYRNTFLVMIIGCACGILSILPAKKGEAREGKPSAEPAGGINA